VKAVRYVRNGEEHRKVSYDVDLPTQAKEKSQGLKVTGQPELKLGGQPPEWLRRFEAA
jgi:hypothetical protein